MNKTLPFVSIIIVNYNGRQYLKNCLDSLFDLNYPKEKVEIILVDNLSTDDSISFIKNNYFKVQVIVNDVNNYCRANNLGIKYAKGKYIALVNNDIIAEKNWLFELVKIMEAEQEVGVVGGKILFKDNFIQSTGHQEYPDYYWGDRGFREKDNGQFDEIEEVNSLCGAALLYRKKCLDEIGPLDEDFIMYLEDLDMALRCKQNKWKILYVPKSIVYHEFRGSSNNEDVRYFSERNRLLLIAKHFSSKLASALYGKGYFIISQQYGKRRNIFDVLPDIFSKLLEQYQGKNIKQVILDVFKSLGRISDLGISILVKQTEESHNIITQKDALLSEKENLINQLRQTQPQADEKIQQLSIQLQTERLTLQLKENLINQLCQTQSQADEKIQQLSIQLQANNLSLTQKDALLSEKENLINQLCQTQSQADEKIQQLSIQLQANNLSLTQKDALLSEKENNIYAITREIIQLKNNLARMIKLDKKDRFLMIKPHYVSAQDTNLALKALRMKYPNSYICLLANLLSPEFEILSKNTAADKKLLFQNDKNKLNLKALMKIIWQSCWKGFDFALVLSSRSRPLGYQGIRKAKVLAFLNNAKKIYIYSVDN